MFASPPEQTLEWSDAGVEGAYRFLKRLWKFAHEYNLHISTGLKVSGKVNFDQAPAGAKNARRIIHGLLEQANRDIAKFQFNTVASAGMKLLNALESTSGAANLESPSGDALETMAINAACAEGFSILLRVLSPITPHICDHLWRELGYGEDILKAPWPEPDAGALQQDEVELVVQVNGKLRGQIKVPVNAGRDLIEQAALAEENIRRFTDGRTVRKTIIVPGRLVNIVVS
jgi:leucyl-tRNA synthetase